MERGSAVGSFPGDRYSNNTGITRGRVSIERESVKNFSNISGEYFSMGAGM